MKNFIAIPIPTPDFETKFAFCEIDWDKTEDKYIRIIIEKMLRNTNYTPTSEIPDCGKDFHILQIETTDGLLFVSKVDPGIVICKGEYRIKFQEKGRDYD